MVSLIKKDFCVVLRQNFGLLLFQMLFVLVITSVNLGVVGYGVMATTFGWTILLTVSMKEKESNSIALLLSMPYEKKTIINARYVTAIIGFFLITILYEVLAIVTSLFQVALFTPLSMKVLESSLFAYALFISITLPLYFKYKDTTVRFISIILIFVSFYIGYLLWENQSFRNWITTIRISEGTYFIGCILLTVISLTISRNITWHLFSKMEY